MKTHPLLLSLLLLAVRPLAASLAADAGRQETVPLPLHFDDVVRANPLDPARGALVTEVLRGERASVNVWQMTNGLPPHYHREHEEVIIVKSGMAAARIGDRTITMKAGDIVLVPRGTVHSAKAIADEGEPFRGISVFAPAFDGKDRVLVDLPSGPPRATPPHPATLPAGGATGPPGEHTH